ncbi:EAL domain-containing protein [Maritimibacter sp. 55A14]|uniref:EAL domain-containing protein n=1 Tax=Maritimibacter sp. 55A14 TaxID=2174844 RepID=UPI001E42AD09|nr:EAL domain-containing protein [Maritimibacter sp. 55A14]
MSQSNVADGSPDPLSAAVAQRDSNVIGMVAEALRRGDVMLAYQPVVLARQPDRAAFHEALIRITDETGRVIPAVQFMDVAETHELGRIIDCHALRLGLRDLHDQPDLRLSINMSARSIGYPAWVETLERGLACAPTVAERLILEITETSAMVMPDIVSVFMAGLARRGITFALDDFGAGFTAFRHFKDFYFDILKIDGQFVRGIDSDPNNQVLASALVSIGRHFDMMTVAESVETGAESAWLAAAGFDCLQGYHHGAPMILPPWKQAAQQRA